MRNLETLPILMTVKEVSELLRTSTKAIYQRIQRGALPGVIRVGGGPRVLIDRDELLSWLRESRASSPEVGR